MKNKALTVKQPYAHLICEGIKDIENRAWKTKYRGRVYIHSSVNYDNRHRDMSMLFTPEQWSCLEVSGIYIMMAASSLTRSAIIGHVDIIDCVENHSSIWALPNHYHWVLANPVLFDKPITEVKGKLSLWDCSEYLCAPNYICSNWNDEPPVDCSGCSGLGPHDEGARKALSELCGYYEPEKTKL